MIEVSSLAPKDGAIKIFIPRVAFQGHMHPFLVSRCFRM